MFDVGCLFGKLELEVTPILALEGLSNQVSHGRLNNLVSLMAIYAERRFFFSINGSSPYSANNLQSSM